MKKTLLLLIALTNWCAAGEASAQHWTVGVSESGGWYDFNKTFQNDKDFCWGAAACNVMAWWQDRNPELAKAAEAPVNAALWDTFRQSFNNCSGEPIYAMQWYFSGTIDDALVLASQTDYGKTHGGYYTELLTGEPVYQYSYLMGLFQYDFTDAKVYSSVLCRLLDEGYGIAMSISGTVKGAGGSVITYGHAITLWGAEVDPDTGILSKIWITDSDDAGDFPSQGLVELACSVKQGTTGKTQYITFESAHLNDGTQRYPLNEAVLNQFVAVKSQVTSWTPPQVPEPATPTLSLLALAGLCTRRRR